MNIVGLLLEGHLLRTIYRLDDSEATPRIFIFLNSDRHHDVKQPQEQALGEVLLGIHNRFKRFPIENEQALEVLVLQRQEVIFPQLLLA